MITEDFVSFETAKLLKEKGFNEKCRGGYHSEFDDNDNSIIMFEEWMAQPYNNDFEDETFLCSAPTHQMAMKWLRNKGIYIQIRRNINTYLYGAIMLKDGSDIYATIPSELETYEEAVEASLKYALENLI